MPAAVRTPNLWNIRIDFDPASGDRYIGLAEDLLVAEAVSVSSFEVDGGPGWAVEAIVTRKPPVRFLKFLATQLPPAAKARTTAQPIAPRDWVAESQRNLPPLRAGRFFVAGTHVAAATPRGCRRITIDAGIAFGTGRHETTRGCLLMLDDFVRQRPFSRVLDLGCGSGILAIAAAMILPDAHIVAADNDVAAVRTTRENAVLNGIDTDFTALKSHGYGAPGLKRRGPYDLVLANILAKPLCRLAPGLAKHLAPGGVAILSGLLRTQEDAVIDAHVRLGLRLGDQLRLGDWSIIALTRPGTQSGRRRLK